MKRYVSKFGEQYENYPYGKFKGEKYYTQQYRNPDAMDSLELFLENDSQLYSQQFMPIIKNIQKKMKSGRYDHSLAPKLWGYYIENGAKKFAPEYTEYNDLPSLPWNKVFDKRDRMIMAQKYADYYYDEIVSGDYD